MARRYLPAVLALLMVLGITAGPATAAGSNPGQAAEAIRTALLQAQLTPNEGARLVASARSVYEQALAPHFAAGAPNADEQVRQGLSAAAAATDPAALAEARSRVWSALLAGSFRLAEEAAREGDAAVASRWLSLREFRRATRFSRPSAEAIAAVERLRTGQMSPADAALAVRADLLDTYQARLSQALHDLASAGQKGFAARATEIAALADGYFAMLAEAYREQRGNPALGEVREAFGELVAGARSGSGIAEPLARVESALRGFRAAPLSPTERSRRAGQLKRFLALVAVEYGRGVSGTTVTRDFEIVEAITFRDGAAAAFADLEDLLQQRDEAKTARAAELFQSLEEKLSAAAAQTAVTPPDEVEGQVTELGQLLTELMPPEWQQRTTDGDFDVISTLLDEMIRAVAAGQYEMAETARLEAYAVLDTGPEARLVAFAPQFIPLLEGLFWHGAAGSDGLARLLQRKAPLADVKAVRSQLDAELRQSQEALKSNGSPFAMGTNAAVIIFREGLEAVLILASLMGSLQRGDQRKLRRPIWWGVGTALLATVLTYLLAQKVLASLARYGERLEAIVSVVAVGVLLLVTNWFFHKSYWTDWIAKFHSQKKRVMGSSAGQWLGLVMIGFTSIYREGFETVLFLQSLVLEAGSAVVLAGSAAGLAIVLLIGFGLFALQSRLPYKKMLIVTGVMIGGVLLTMVGNTVHTFQIVGWMPTSPIRSIELPHWAGTWFGLFATWEGLALQAAAAVFVIGSYYLAEYMQRRESRSMRMAAPEA